MPSFTVWPDGSPSPAIVTGDSLQSVVRAYRRIFDAIPAAREPTYYDPTPGIESAHFRTRSGEGVYIYATPTGGSA